MIADHTSGQAHERYGCHRTTITRHVFRPQRVAQTRRRRHSGGQTVEFQVAGSRGAPGVLRSLPDISLVQRPSNRLKKRQVCIIIVITNDRHVPGICELLRGIHKMHSCVARNLIRSSVYTGYYKNQTHDHFKNTFGIAL